MANWLKDAVVYEIYPQSFYDTNGDGIGDLQGIIEKLDYIQDLGFTAIWLNPINESTFFDAGYDVTDYYKVAPRYGTNEDYRRLCEEVHKRGMKIVFDLVAGHTSVEHPWFKESGKAEVNEYTNRYIWTNNVFDDPIGELEISGWSEREGNYVTNFFWCQPALNYGYAHPDPKKPWQLPVDHPDCIATKEELKKIIYFWMDMGVDAFRVDMAESLIKGDKDGSFMRAFWKEVREGMEKKNADALLIAEWGKPTDAINAGFHCDFLLHSQHQAYTRLFRAEPGRNTTHFWDGHSYFNKDGKGNINDYLDRFCYDLENTRGKGYVGLITGNHDIPRLAYQREPDEVKLALAFLHTMPGVPFVYYGDEIGMDYIAGLKSKEGGYNRTGSRTPMQWNDEKNHGFSASDAPYLPTDDRPDAPTVEKQKDDPHSLLNFTKWIVGLHKQEAALKPDGEFEILRAGYPFVFTRKAEDSTIYVAINPSRYDYALEEPGVKEILYSQNASVADGKLTLSGVSMLIARI